MCLRQIRVQSRTVAAGFQSMRNLYGTAGNRDHHFLRFTGKESPIKDQKDREIPYYGVKEAVFPFNMFQEVDPAVRTGMRSTGEVLGLAQSVGEAYFKAQEATKGPLRSQEPF